MKKSPPQDHEQALDRTDLDVNLNGEGQFLAGELLSG
jgi:hypothetical protein